MIAAAVLLAAAAPATAPALPPKPAKTSLFLKCEAKGADSKPHVLQLVFFDPKPAWAKGFNFYDPDKILPAGVAPEVSNHWPRLLEIELDSKVGGNSALIQLAPEGQLKTAILNIAVINALGAGQPGYTGRCTFTDGAAAEAEFKGLMKL